MYNILKITQITVNKNIVKYIKYDCKASKCGYYPKHIIRFPNVTFKLRNQKNGYRRANNGCMQPVSEMRCSRQRYIRQQVSGK